MISDGLFCSFVIALKLHPLLHLTFMLCTAHTRSQRSCRVVVSPADLAAVGATP